VTELGASRRKRNRLNDGTLTERRRAAVSFDVAAREWLDLHSKPNLRSHQDNVERYETHLHPFFGDAPLASVTPGRILELRGKLQAARAPATVNRVMALVRSILNFAVVQGHIAASPVARIGRGRLMLAVERKKMAPPIATLADAGRLLAVIGDIERETNRYGLRALFATLLYSGMRRGEGLGLRWADVDLDRRIITIRRSYAAMTKSGKQRTVPVATPLVEILKAHRIADPWKGELVFPNDSGAMYSPAAKLEHVLDAALARAGMPRIRVHDLRHAAASFFLMNGGDVFTLQKILGHSTPQLVSDTYGHLSDSHLAGEADRFAFPEPGQLADVIPLAGRGTK
jgi:integrase